MNNRNVPMSLRGVATTRAHGRVWIEVVLVESISRLEPSAAVIDGPALRISNPTGDPEIILHFKSEQRAKTAFNAIQNYLEVVDVDPHQESILRMLELVFGQNGNRGDGE